MILQSLKCGDIHCVSQCISLVGIHRCICAPMYIIHRCVFCDGGDSGGGVVCVEGEGAA